jgi:hypothetical protein
MSSPGKKKLSGNNPNRGSFFKKILIAFITIILVLFLVVPVKVQIEFLNDKIQQSARVLGISSTQVNPQAGK